MIEFKKETKLDKLFLLMIAFSVPIPQLRLSLSSFEVPIYLVLIVTYFLFNIKNIKQSKIPLNVLIIIFYFTLSMLLTSLININNFGINMNLIIKYIINFMFMLMIFVVNFSNNQLLIILKGSLFSFLVYMLLTIYLYIIVNNKDFIGVDFTNYTTIGRNSLSIILGVFLIASMIILENNIIKTLMLIVFGVSSFLLQSRGLIISLFFVVLVYMILHMRKSRIKSFFKSFSLIIIVSLIGIFIMKKYINLDIIFDRIKTINIFNPTNDDISSNLSRKLLFKKGIEIISNNFIFGVGLGNFGNYTSTSVSTLHIAHNDYIGIFSEMGIFGAILIVVLFFSIFPKIIKNITSKGYSNKILLFLSMVNLYFIIYMFFIDLINTPFYWFFLTLFIIEDNRNHQKKSITNDLDFDSFRNVQIKNI